MLLLRDLMLNGQNSSPKACELDKIMDQPLFLINPAAQEESAMNGHWSMT
jgi:hypothetical protein